MWKLVRSHFLGAYTMPDRNALRVGDRIRLLRVPTPDLEQRARLISEGKAVDDSTANIIERIIESTPVVEIESVHNDCPWFEVALPHANGIVEYHSIAVIDDDSWECV